MLEKKRVEKKRSYELVHNYLRLANLKLKDMEDMRYPTVSKLQDEIMQDLANL